jgi:multidrug resistance efflux pump
MAGLNLLVEKNSEEIRELERRLEKFADHSAGEHKETLRLLTAIAERIPQDLKARMAVAESSIVELKDGGREVTGRIRLAELEGAKAKGAGEHVKARVEVDKARIALYATVVTSLITGIVSILMQVFGN